MRSIRNIFISCLAFFLLWIGLIYLQLGNPTQQSRWVYETYLKKEKYGLSINKQKIVIVSGSNSLFGINSKMIENAVRVPVVNDAVHAGLLMPYILHKSKKILRRGDIAILPLEYDDYYMDSIPSETYSDFIVSRDPEYFSRLSIEEKFKVIISIGFKRCIRGLLSPFRKLHETVGIYGVQNINLRGDQVNIEYSKMSKKQFEFLNTLQASKVKSVEVSDEFKESMNDYISWAKSKNITLIFMPPNHMYFKYYDSHSYQLFLQNIKEYYSGNDVLYVGDPKNYMYNKKYYFNTSYHLNDIGVEKRTKQLISDIQPVWKLLTKNSRGTLAALPPLN